MDHRAFGIDQGDRFTTGRQGKIGMQFTGRIALIPARRENDHKRPRRQGHLGKPPLRQIVQIVGQRPAGQVGCRAAGILNLDPIGVVADLVPQAAVVQRDELADDQVARPGRHRREPHEQRSTKSSRRVVTQSPIVAMHSFRRVLHPALVVQAPPPHMRSHALTPF